MTILLRRLYDPGDASGIRKSGYAHDIYSIKKLSCPDSFFYRYENLLFQTAELLLK
jgi:hypothetical protein